MTINEIAKLAGVSASTVSKIINNKDQSINPETRERVLRIVKEYNYTPYGMIKSTSQAKTFLLAVLFRYTGKANQLVSAVVHTAQKHGYSVLIFDSQNDPAEELKHITAICQKNADGVLWDPVNADSAKHAHYFEERGIQICYLNRAPLFPSYQIDFMHMGYTLTQKLIDFRHSRIACLMKENNPRSELVREGYRKCLYDNQIPYDHQLELFVTDEDCCSKMMTYHVTGIVSSHYAAALTLYEQLDQLHYNVPSDFSLVSLKNDISDAGAFPHISGLEIPYGKFGCYICEALIQKCEKKEDASASLLFTPSCAFSQEDSIDLPPTLRSRKIVVVGSINIDNTFSVDGVPQAGETTRILDSTVSLGGKGANQAIGAARLGSEVSLITSIGSDLDSNFAIHALTSEQLSTQGVFRDMGMQTGKAYIYIQGDGESTITILPGANAHLSSERIRHRRHLFQNAGYCLLSTEIPLEAAIEAARISHSCGAKNIVNPAALKLMPKELIPYTDIFIPNRKAAAALCPEHHYIEDQADYFFELGIPVTIITLGHEGCYLRTKDVSRFFPAADVTAIDTTGGADAFISALAVYLTEGLPLEKAIEIGTCAASFCVARLGVVPALVDKTTLEAYVSRVHPGLLER